MTNGFRDGYTVSRDSARVDMDHLFAWLSEESYWAKGRDRDTIQRSVVGSSPYCVFAPDGTQVAFARVVTDGATFAWICDVYVEPRPLTARTPTCATARSGLLVGGPPPPARRAASRRWPPTRRATSARRERCQRGRSRARKCRKPKTARSRAAPAGRPPPRPALTLAARSTSR